MKFVLAAMVAVLGFVSQSQAAGQIVRPSDAQNYEPGTIVVRSSKYVLDMILEDGTALRFPVAMPKIGKGWYGPASVTAIHQRPAWIPPAVVRRDNPDMKSIYQSGDPENPMGPWAIMLSRSQLAIHGTNAKTRKSMGTNASYGCVRMRNEDISELVQYVDVNTPVVVVK